MKTWLGKLIRWTCGLFGLLAIAATSAHAAPTLSAAAVTAGFGLSEFADQFPTTGFCCGPLGIAFVDGGKVMVSDYAGNVRIFASDADGQHAGAAPVASTWGSNNPTGLARSGNFVYLARQATGDVVRLNLDGTFNSTVVGGIPTATGVYTNPTNGKLFVSDCCNGTGIWQIDPSTNIKTLFKSGSYDGISISADGTKLYAENNGHILGFLISDGSLTFDSGFISGADGTELGAGTLAGEIFVNTNGGEVWEVDLADATNKTLLVAGGSRGDFVTADPNGTLLFTQTDSIWRLTAPSGGCIGNSCGVPEPGSLALVGLGLLGLARSRRILGLAQR